MNKLLFSLLLLVLGGQALNAQKTETTAAPTATNDQEIRKATEALTAKYQLNADQAKQMYTIQARKAKNLAQIESLKSSDPALYRAKVQNVQKGTLANIQRILNTKDQVALYKKTQSDLRVQRNKKQKELVGNNASREAIENALLAIYAE
jgi:preprotein translocase subunit SecF